MSTLPLDGHEFATFWRKYPRKVAKIAAEKAFKKARKTASLQDILDGIDRYVQSKPEYADYCFPTSFLNQGRWMDEVTVTKRHAVSVDEGRRLAQNVAIGGHRSCPHDPMCRTWGDCTKRILAER